MSSSINCYLWEGRHDMAAHRPLDEPSTTSTQWLYMFAAVVGTSESASLGHVAVDAGIPRRHAERKNCMEI